MKNIIKTIVAFTLLGIVVIGALLLSASDNSSDVYPNENTKISLYGEAHGFKTYYDLEFSLWEECYEKGERALFVELPYYTAEFMNLWMQEDSDEKLDGIFEDIQGTQACNQFFYEFLHKIKENCPETVFFGTDVGHQYATTGQRYIEYLEENGLEGTENYRLAKECIQQGIDYYSDDTTHNGMSPTREAYMVSNFIDAYSRCGSEKIMGIYGSYHTDLNIRGLMAGELKAHYGDIISSVKMCSVAFGKNEPYRFGFCITGLFFLLMLFIPNIYWGAKAKPVGYDEASKKENKVLLIFERGGEVLVTCALVVFPALNPYVKALPEGLFFDYRLIIWIAAFVLMIFYECYWIKYFKGERTLRAQYSSFAGFPLAGATLPVIAVFLLGLYSLNLVVIISAVILGIGHIGIHFMHYKEARTSLISDSCS